MQINLKLDTTVIGYAMSATIFCIGLALSARVMHQAPGDTAWAGLSTMVFPLGISYLTLMVTEGIRTLQSGKQ